MTLTTDAAPPEVPPAKPLRYGLVIEWPVPSRTPPLPITFAEVCVHEIGPDGTERYLPAVTGLTLHVTPDGVTADVETLLAEDGEPFAHEGPGLARAENEKTDRDGVPVVAARRYVVAEMRVSDTWTRHRPWFPPPAGDRNGG